MNICLVKNPNFLELYKFRLIFNAYKGYDRTKQSTVFRFLYL